MSLPGLKQPFANRVVALFICMTQIFSHWLVWACVSAQKEGGQIHLVASGVTIALTIDLSKIFF